MAEIVEIMRCQSGVAWGAYSVLSYHGQNVFSCEIALASTATQLAT